MEVSRFAWVWEYLESPRDSIKKVLETINVYNKVNGHKVNIESSVAFLYAGNKKLKCSFMYNCSKELNLTKDMNI